MSHKGTKVGVNECIWWPPESSSCTMVHRRPKPHLTTTYRFLLPSLSFNWRGRPISGEAASVIERAACSDTIGGAELCLLWIGWHCRVATYIMCMETCWMALSWLSRSVSRKCILKLSYRSTDFEFTYPKVSRVGPLISLTAGTQE